MKKTLVVLGTIIAVLLMISSSTAVPQTQSEVISKKLQIRDVLNEFKENDLKFPIKDFVERVLTIVLLLPCFCGGWIVGATIGRVYIIFYYIIDCIYAFIEEKPIDAIKDIAESLLGVIFLFIFAGGIGALWTVDLTDEFAGFICDFIFDNFIIPQA